MKNDETILLEIKQAIHLLVPDAKISLFGSRANGNYTEESDWDILILTQTKYSKEMRWKVQDLLFPISVKIAAFIDINIVQEQEWNTEPGYYSLRMDISKNETIAL